MKKIVFWLVLSAVVITATAVLITVAFPLLRENYRPLLVEYLAANLPEAEKEKIYRGIEQQAGALWDVVPEPEVARIAQANIHLEQNQADIVINNAGMRSSRPYGPKAADEYRIVCLGDSFVFGVGGKEEDRFCDQIEALYKTYNVQLSGKSIKTLALGVGSWTMRQQVAYLSSRLSSYDPDLIIVLSVNNDIGASSGVTGRGFLTNEFSPEDRQWGSAVFNNQLPLLFGINKKNLVDADISPLSGTLWLNAMGGLQKLARLQQDRNKKILFSVLDTKGGRNELFIQTYHRYFAQLGINAPLITIPYSRTKETSLVHDGHPNRHGHEIIAQHYIQAFQQLNWISPPPIAPFNNQQALKTTSRFSKQTKDELSQQVVAEEVFTALDFGNLDKNAVASLLGGLFPEKEGPLQADSILWASVRSAFLLKKPSASARQIYLQIDVPERPELAHLALTIEINGATAAQYDMTGKPFGKQHITITIPEKIMAKSVQGEVLELLIYANSYFTEMDDHRMKSFMLREARVF